MYDGWVDFLLVSLSVTPVISSIFNSFFQCVCITVVSAQRLSRLFRGRQKEEDMFRCNIPELGSLVLYFHD